MTKHEYEKNFKNYYNDVKFASPDKQYSFIIKFIKYLIEGYDKKYVDISDIGAWVASTWLALNCGDSENSDGLGIIISLGLKGDFFDQGEKRVKEEWGVSYEQAEREFISQLRGLIEISKEDVVG